MRVIVPQVIFTTIIIIKSKDQGIIKRILQDTPPIHKASSSLDVDGVGLISFARCGLQSGL